ncbi:uncharacterized protein EDB91DRAFT_1335360 [Suillus paluster]|uniref:uncharacterized protein n=1 Tax=Suillus paluster TaxID=48578 RepID=UPI001B87D947|nr:uncharacterized protein EDB91DRAFT_1335360 [Suillus paluster]KAG1745478.1 hypothetical protein EDB91DRAFT_1335360 [Suillus paluster]
MSLRHLSSLQPPSSLFPWLQVHRPSPHQVLSGGCLFLLPFWLPFEPLAWVEWGSPFWCSTPFLSTASLAPLASLASLRARSSAAFCALERLLTCASSTTLPGQVVAFDGRVRRVASMVDMIRQMDE